MSDLWAGALAGALVSEAVKGLIEETKKFKNFKPLSKDLASTLERLSLLIGMVDSSPGTIYSLQKELNFDARELERLKECIERAQTVVHKCRGVWWLKRSKLTREIEQVNKDILYFCQTDLPVLQHRNQLQSMKSNKENFESLHKKVDRQHSPVYRHRCSVPKPDKVLIGLDFPLMELKKKLLDDAVVRLVVSAPPGCGKTSLVTQLCHDQEIKRNFEYIFYCVVSSTPNFRVIVQDLLEDNGYQARTFSNDPQAANALRNMLEGLEGNRILLVLDDVWSGADSFLKNFRINLPGYKVLVTSRFDLPDFGHTYRLKPLEHKDAKDLLIEVAPKPPNASQAEYEDLLQKILKRCDGIPLVIEVIGVSLIQQPFYLWKSWSEWEPILSSPTMLERLQPSFSALKPRLKECFMDMGSFLEDQKIRASVITDIWVELYGKGTSSSDVYMKHLNDLASQNLLKLIPLGGNEHEDGFYNEFVVTQHDILRELAIHQNESEPELRERKRLNVVIQGDNYPDWYLNQSETIINARFLSISTDDLFSSSWVEMDLCHFPNVEALVLNLSSSNYALPSFIATMKKLKVVIIINHSLHSTNLTNLSCLSSLPKLKRIRLEKVSITFLDILQLQLGSLRKLSFFMCSFGEVSYDQREVDVSKALSSLQEIDIDYCYDLKVLPYWVSEVVSLKTLSITNCNKLTKLPEAIGNLCRLEVLRLNSCINLSELPETTDRLCSLRFLDISHCLDLRKLPLEIGKLQKLKKISMSKCCKCELPDSVINLENLTVKCDEETGTVLWERLMPKMLNLSVHEEETEHNLNKLQMF